MNTKIKNDITESSHVVAPVFNYKCKKCGSTYTQLKKQLTYINCFIEKPITKEKCNGQLVQF